MVTTLTCVTCGDELERRYVPAKITMTCEHRGQSCISCLRQWIAARFDSAGFGNTPCPECEENMEYSDIKRHVTKKTFARYVSWSEMQRRHC